MIIGRSVETKKIDKKVVQAKIYLMSFILRKVDDNNTSLTMFHWMDPKIASMITN